MVIGNLKLLGRPMRRRLNSPMLRIIFFFFIWVNINQRIVYTRNLIQINDYYKS